MNRAFFLDRDGTINFDYGYVGDANRVTLIPGMAQAIRKMNNAGFLVLVVTNQSGVARGYFDLDAVSSVNKKINELLASEGAHIDDFFICPHLPDAGVADYRLDCDCRKPKLGLFKKAISDYNLIPSQCYACGDRARDVENLPLLGVPEDHLFIVDSPEQFEAFFCFINQLKTEHIN